jgi:hypothetical protein
MQTAGMKTRKPSNQHAGRARNSRGFVIAICLLLGLAILAIYSQTFDYGFVSYDDDRYVYDNPMVKMGISPQGLSRAFTTFYASNWHPLTWISYILDYELFGLRPRRERPPALRCYRHSFPRPAANDETGMGIGTCSRGLCGTPASRGIRGLDRGAKGRPQRMFPDADVAALRTIRG